MAEPFKFYECLALTRLTGKKASDIIEFLEIIEQISPESIFHHMHQYFLRRHVIAPEFSNDFAVWIADSLGERSLAEGVANLNPYEFTNIEDTRKELARIISEHLRNYPPPRPALPGKEFFFTEGISFLIPTGLGAKDLDEFGQRIKEVDGTSIYFHFYEARLRLGKKGDDFSRFFEGLGHTDLADKIKAMDPYMYSTEVLRNKIRSLVEGLI